jgi:hypothetical protein
VAIAIAAACAGCELVFPAGGGPAPGAIDAGAMIDGARPDGPPGDLDGDTIMDDFDNCPDVANSDQANEDDDRLGDVCDDCPFVAESVVVDGDSDGVGDACDPHPGLPGDQIRLFDGFEGDTMSWDRIGTWTLTGGAIEDTADVGFKHLLLALGSWVTPDVELHVQARLVVNPAPGAPGGLAGIVLDYEGGATGLVCGLRYQGGTVYQGIESPVTGAGIADGVRGDVTNTFVYRFTAVGQTRTCALGAGNQPDTIAANVGPVPAHFASVGLFTSQARIAAEWIVIYTSPLP